MQPPQHCPKPSPSVPVPPFPSAPQYSQRLEIPATQLFLLPVTLLSFHLPILPESRGPGVPARGGSQVPRLAKGFDRSQG